MVVVVDVEDVVVLEDVLDEDVLVEVDVDVDVEVVVVDDDVDVLVDDDVDVEVGVGWLGEPHPRKLTAVRLTKMAVRPMYRVTRTAAL